MKQILIALLVAWVTCSVVNAQNQTQVNDSNTAVTVVSTDAIHSTDSVDDDADTASPANASSFNANNAATTHHAQANIVFDDDDFPFNHFEDAVGGSILIIIISIIMVFGFPVFIIFIIFFFRYKNRKARYRLAEQAIAAGRPLPENILKEIKPDDPCAQGIRNTFTGIGLFVFLWGLTDFSIGAIGLLIMFMGLGQWLIGYRQQKKQANTPTPPQEQEQPQEPQQEPQPIYPSEDVNDENR